MKNNVVEAIARSLVLRAARRAPAALPERLEEEWLADFAERRSVLARLRFAVGCSWATQVIAHEFAQPKMAAAAAGGGSVEVGRYSRPDFSFLSRRTVAVFGILGLHAVLIYGLATGVVHTAIKKFVPPPVTVMPTPPKVIDRPPPLPPPTFHDQVPSVDPDINVPKIEDNLAPQLVSPMTEGVVGPVGTGGPAVPAAPPVKRVLGGPNKTFPASDDYYPASIIRMGITGTVTVSVCTDERGRLTADPTLVQSSGTAGLDQGALRLAKVGSGHYRPTLEDERAISSCFPFRVTFNLRK